MDETPFISLVSNFETRKDLTQQSQFFYPCHTDEVIPETCSDQQNNCSDRMWFIDIPKFAEKFKLTPDKAGSANSKVKARNS